MSDLLFNDKSPKEDGTIFPCPEPVIEKFLDEGTMLLIAVKSENNDNSDLLDKIEFKPENIQDLRNGYKLVPVYIKTIDKLINEVTRPKKLKDNNHQYITFKITDKTTNISNMFRKLGSCFYETPVEPDNTFDSLNNALQVISGKFEKSRSSMGGRVYDYVYYEDQEDNTWKLLRELRNKLFAPHKLAFEKYLISKGTIIGSYLRLHPSSIDYIKELLGQKESLIHDLQISMDNMKEQISYLNNLFQDSKLHVYEQALTQFEHRLKLNLPETAGSDSWQSWIYKNNWLFGSQYAKLLQKIKIDVDKIPDFLLLTADGFLDVLEIKKPDDQVITEDKSHPGNFHWSGEVNKSHGQVNNYLTEIDRHHLDISKRIKQHHKLDINAIKPRGIILIGKSDGWEEIKRERFRSLNHDHHRIEVITYTDLLKRGRNLIKIYRGQ